ncbi:hypothetical protein C9I87_10885 [Photobacterium iliopiscarium]|uniref:hypothetical protein n=1 Tax=Photobacterium iliopiscarium TaxID=56192 RepID=UPI000D176C5D|nr:hypothetical protein [Photobacterium iliopiscarium]PST95153.1 hypothetical protein C9I87_10885 [Photobacterium iliopiscarium]
MNDKIKFVLNGFKNLTTNEKKEFFKIIKDFNEYPILTEREIKKSIGMENLSEGMTINKSNNIVFGPNPSGCSCCGK